MIVIESVEMFCFVFGLKTALISEIVFAFLVLVDTTGGEADAEHTAFIAILHYCNF